MTNQSSHLAEAQGNYSSPFCIVIEGMFSPIGRWNNIVHSLDNAQMTVLFIGLSVRTMIGHTVVTLLSGWLLGAAREVARRKPPQSMSLVEAERQQILDEMRKRTALLTDNSWIRQRSTSDNRQPTNQRGPMRR